MDKNQQIAAIKSALAAIDSAIAQAEAALRTASNPDDIRSLTSTLVDLRSERSRLQAQLDNLEAATTEVAALGQPAVAAPDTSRGNPSMTKAELKSLHGKLSAAITDRSVVDATLKFAQGVSKNATRLRAAGSAATDPGPKRRK